MNETKTKLTKESKMTETGAIRSIIMNELGLTRNYIKEVAQTIIEDEVKKYISKNVNYEMLIRDQTRILVESYMLKRDSWYRENNLSFEVAVKKEAIAATEKFIKDNIKITFTNGTTNKD